MRIEVEHSFSVSTPTFSNIILYKQVKVTPQKDEKTMEKKKIEGTSFDFFLEKPATNSPNKTRIQ